MSHPSKIQQVARDKHLASLGDAYVNLVYSLALTALRGYPQGTKVSDRILATAFREAGLRDVLGSRVAKKDLANASEALLAEAYRKGYLGLEESVKIVTRHSENPPSGLSELLKLAAEKIQSG